MEKIKASKPMYETTFTKGIFSTTLTFNDVLLVPQYGEIESRYLMRLKLGHNA